MNSCYFHVAEAKGLIVFKKPVEYTIIFFCLNTILLAKHLLHLSDTLPNASRRHVPL